MTGSPTRLPATAPGGGRGRLLAILVALVAAAIGAVAYTVFRQGAEGRAIRDLPADERAAEYRRIHQELESLCRNARGALQSHCQQQALFLSYFPECDAECRDLVRRQFPPEPAR